MRSHLRRLLGFALVPALSLLASLVLLPLISSRFGADGWVSLNLGQSVGAIVSVVVGMAWPVIGGNAVSRAQDDEERRGLYLDSVCSRLLVLVVLVAVAAPLTVLLAHGYVLATVFFMVGIAGNGMTAAWYYSGTGQPRHLVINEGVVRLGGYAVALVGLLAGAGLLWYALMTTASVLAMFVLNWLTIMGRRLPVLSPPALSARFRSSVGIVREQLAGTGSRVLGASFSFGGPIVFSIVAPTALPLFSVFDQLQKAMSNALSVLPNAFVSWVGSAERDQRRGRVARSLLFLFAVAAVFVVAWVFLGPTVVDLLFADRVALGWPGNLALALSVALFQVCFAIQLLVLVPLGFERLIYLGNSVGAVLGLIALVAGALLAGALGGVAAWILIDLALLGFFLLALRRDAAGPMAASSSTTVVP